MRLNRAVGVKGLPVTPLTNWATNATGTFRYSVRKYELYAKARCTRVEFYAQILGLTYLLLTPDVLEVASDRVGLIRGERVDQTRRPRHRHRQRAETVAEAEIVERTALVRTKLLEGGLRVSTEILPVGERRLLGEFQQSDVDQTAREVTRQIGCVGLQDRERLDEFRREEIERDHAPRGIGAGQPALVQEGAAVALAESADEHEPVVLDGDRGNALHDRGDVLVRRLLDHLRADRLADHGRLLPFHELRGLGGLVRLGRHLDHLDVGRRRGEADALLGDLIRLHLHARDLYGLVERRRDAELVGAGRELQREVAVHVGLDSLRLTDDLHASLDEGVTGGLVQDGADERSLFWGRHGRSRGLLGPQHGCPSRHRRQAHQCQGASNEHPQTTSASRGSYADDVSGRLRIDEVDASDRLRTAGATRS